MNEIFLGAKICQALTSTPLYMCPACKCLSGPVCLLVDFVAGSSFVTRARTQLFDSVAGYKALKTDYKCIIWASINDPPCILMRDISGP
jgi:hypothetical protein